MRLLLDTHALLWTLNQPDRLSQKAVAAILDPDSELVVSVASAFEIATKFRIGKLREAAALLNDYEGSLREMNAVQLSISSRHALLSGSLPGSHKDPFDRLLAAQSLLEGLTLVSADPAFDAFGIQRFW